MAALVDAQGEILDNIENQVRYFFLFCLPVSLGEFCKCNSASGTLMLAVALDLQVQSAVNHVQTGTEALRSAKSMQKKSRKCMMIAIILLLVIAGIIVLSVLKPWANK
jgi:syntaxin 1B/2/3